MQFTVSKHVTFHLLFCDAVSICRLQRRMVGQQMMMTGKFLEKKITEQVPNAHYL